MQKPFVGSVTFYSLIASCLLVALLVALPASALMIVKVITPDSKEESGMTVKFKRAKEGACSFTVTRHNVPTGVIMIEGKGVDFQDNYAAYLEVRKGQQLIARTTLAPEKQGNSLAYAFDLARDCFKDSSFSFSEGVVPTANGQHRSFMGDMYHLDMKEIDRRIQASIPQHP
jgi:hypothetical protein